MNKSDIQEGDIIIIDVKNKGHEVWESKVIIDDGELMLESNQVYLSSIPDSWIKEILC